MFHIRHGAVPQPLCAQKHHHWGEARPRGFWGSPGSSCRGDPLWAEQRRRSRGGLGGHSWVLSFTAVGITCSLLVPRVPEPQSPSQGILQLLGKTFWLLEFLEEETLRARPDGAAGLVPAPSLACGVPYLPPSHTNILFPSHCSLTSFLLPQKSRLWCSTAFVEQCWDVLPARITGWSQEAELRERKQSELEIPRRSSPLTRLLLSPPNLLTFGKGESLQFACFSRFPLSPVLCRAVSGPSTMEGTGCGGRRKVNDP